MFGNVAMGDLRQSVHAGIGAPGTVNANVFAADRLDGLFKRALNRGAVFLNLPAAERRAIIFDEELIAGHQLSRIGGLSAVPRKNSSAFIGALPARCNSTIRKTDQILPTIKRTTTADAA